MQATSSVARPTATRIPWRTLSYVLVFGALIIIVYARSPLITVAVLTSTLRQSTPIILGALGGILCERSGVINIGIEGMMLLSAFLGFLFNVWTGNLWLAVAGAVLAGGLVGGLHALMSITLKVDQIISGTVINILAVGLTGYFYQQGLTTQGKLTPIQIPLLADIPIIGPVFFNNPPITYSALILIGVIHFALFYTRWGLRTRAVGEHPTAADTVGVQVNRMRYSNVIMGGMLAGLAGGFLTLEAVGSFERNMTNGRGFVALAVMIFGKWTPLGAWAGALLFGFANGLQTQIQFLQNQLPDWLAWIGQIPHQFIGMLPYLLTVVVLAGFVGRARPPAAIGTVYEKE
ncbi:MAG TPA: ABC transporter permease [Roseiflexaceae bacterium]|nr:ABC transporter permease [Roseiflexaceae bacterium]